MLTMGSKPKRAVLLMQNDYINFPGPYPRRPTPPFAPLKILHLQAARTAVGFYKQQVTCIMETLPVIASCESWHRFVDVIDKSKEPLHFSQSSRLQARALAIQSSTLDALRLSSGTYHINAQPGTVSLPTGNWGGA